MEKTLFKPEYRILLGPIRQARVDAGATQEAIASKPNIPRTTVVKWETGQQRMDVLEFWALCEGIGTDPLDLLRQFKKVLEFAK